MGHRIDRCTRGYTDFQARGSQDTAADKNYSLTEGVNFINTTTNIIIITMEVPIITK